jgi:hypothetical protein
MLLCKESAYALSVGCMRSMKALAYIRQFINMFQRLHLVSQGVRESCPSK